MTLLEIFRAPLELAKEPLLNKLIGALQITAIGMTLTFTALILVWLTVRLLARFTAEKPARESQPARLPLPAPGEDAEQKVAAMAAVLALIGDDCPDRVRVKKIIRDPADVFRWSDWSRK
jgi:Na+-transporting methylmalonyl-CoA/oxaloacetate decarboxylase gamma subunit